MNMATEFFNELAPGVLLGMKVAWYLMKTKTWIGVLFGTWLAVGSAIVTPLDSSVTLPLSEIGLILTYLLSFSLIDTTVISVLSGALKFPFVDYCTSIEDDGEHLQWKWRRKEDLSQRHGCFKRNRKRKEQHCFNIAQMKTLQNNVTWDSLPSPRYSPNEWSNVLQKYFDWNVSQCPDLLDIIKSGVAPVNDDLNINRQLICPGIEVVSLDRIEGVYFGNGMHSNPVVFDTGASISLSNKQSDFIEWYDDGNTTQRKVQGVSSTTAVQGYGRVRWHFTDDKGSPQSIEVDAYYIPESPVRLLSPQRYFDENPRGGMLISSKRTRFLFENQATITFQSLTNGSVKLPVAELQSPPTLNFHHALSLTDVLHDTNMNLTMPMKELLSWHYKLGHFHLGWIQSLCRQSTNSEEAPLKCKTDVTKVDVTKLKCAGCCAGKQTRTPEGASIAQKVKKKDGVLKQGNLKVGSVVSTDQYVCNDRGRLEHTQGKELQKDKYSGGTIFVEHASSYIFINHQVSLKASETLAGKHKFERELHKFGHKVEKYKADNGVYKSAEFMSDIKKCNQEIEFCGVGAHHQNGVAERAIRTVTTSARTMMLHAAIHWPSEISTELWPFAMEYAVYLWNRMPGRISKVTPLEIMTGTKLDASHLRSSHVWGCPCYVLDPKAQDGKKLPRWVPRSRKGQFLGRSRRHASTVGLIRNLNTGSITTQFHVVYDDYFTTISSTKSNIAEDNSFGRLWNHAREDVLPPDQQDEPPALSDEWRDSEELRRRRQSEQQRELERRAPPPRGINPDPKNQTPVQPSHVNDDSSVNSSGSSGREMEHQRHVEEDIELEQSNEGSSEPTPPSQQPSEEPSIQHRRNPSRRLKGINRRYNNDDFVSLASGWMHDRNEARNWNFLCSMNYSENSPSLQLSSMLLEEYLSTDDDGLLGNIDPMMLSTKANAEDNPTFHQAMSSEEADGWYKAMETEIEQLLKLDVWEEVPRSSVKNDNIIDCTWAFKKKRFPDGTVRKLKARLCVRGDQQLEGIDYFETYAPVVQWSTVRMLLVLSVALNLVTKQVDYTNAFVQAPLKDTVYMELPRCFEKEGYVVRLKRSLYGLVQSPLNFFNHLRDGLVARNWTPSDHDPCVFYKDGLVCLVYVDDCLFFGKNMKSIDKEIEYLKQAKPTKLYLEEENNVAGFLGILLQRKDDGTLELLQEGLIKRIIAALGLEDSMPKETPANKEPLGKDENGAPRLERWNYRSVVGMMMYLATNSRPDIAFAVNQCARHAMNPRRSHEKAVKRIGRYLKGTMNQGMIINPTEDLSLDLYADADFAGLYNAEDVEDPVSVKSRTGWVMTLGNIPVTWASKLQSEIALSTMEAEYIALSTGMRELVGCRKLINEITENCKIERKGSSKISRVWEDNAAALKHALVPMPKLNPRTKHIAVKYHWFKSKIEPGKIEMNPIGTKTQKADIFTKGLTAVEFKAKRKLVMGW